MSATTNKKVKPSAVKAPSAAAVDRALPQNSKTLNNPASSTAQTVRRRDNVASLLRLQANAKLTKDRLEQKKSTASGDSLHGPRRPDSSSAMHVYPGGNSMRAEHRAQSVQNICRIPVAVASNGKTHLPMDRGTVKRAASSQNISSKSDQQIRPPVNAAAAYNAELLANFEREKKSLEAQIADLTSQLQEAKEREQLNENADSSELASLRLENESLREQLAKEQLKSANHDEHFTDAEKLRLLQWQTLSPQQRYSVGDLQASFDLRPVTSGGLDRRSSVSVDCGLDHGPASVAALRDRLALMKDAHDSTMEELEATLQELDDLQRSVCELTSDNEKLNDERTILLESLCTQTEKLEHARLQVEHLKTLLLSGNSPPSLETVARGRVEPDLAASLAHGVEEERDELRLRQAELSHALKQLEAENTELRATVGSLHSSSHAADGQHRSDDEEVKVEDTSLPQIIPITDFQS